jgi:hypothetical protein
MKMKIPKSHHRTEGSILVKWRRKDGERRKVAKSGEIEVKWRRNGDEKW